MSITLLAIESSCDDTAAAVLRDGNILANVVAGQEVHSQYGGVVPELASRAHQQNIIPVVEAALAKAGISKEKLNGIAFTLGPGLMGSLLVGSCFAKAMAMGLSIPIITVNHMEAHVMAHFIDEPKPTFPFLCLTVSGGHTQIVLVEDYLKMKLIGETLDDAAGEAFDKTAKLLGLPYPGGPLIDKYAQQGNPEAYKFTEPNIPDLNFSFSGLKTGIMYFLQENAKKNENFITENLNDICASVQKRIISILLNKLEKAVAQTGIKEVGIAGGVSANSGLRKALEEKGKEQGWNIYIPKFEYCTDNAAMIAIAGYYKYLQNDFAAMDVVPLARFKI